MTDAVQTVYLNGQFVPAAEAQISVLDRGFLFGDGVYEVIPAYGRRLFRLEQHLDRLDHSLDGIRLTNPLPHDQWRSILERLVECNPGEDQSVYLQVTRGVAARDHGFPSDTQPTVFAMSSALASGCNSSHSEGISAIAVEDIRWRYCNIKAIALLPNVLLRQQALDSGAAEAILVRDGQVTEGAASNVFIVIDGEIRTPPKGKLLLPGITRDLVVELCHQQGLPCREVPVLLTDLQKADEIWITSSTKEVVPVTRLDGVPVGNGEPGPVWAHMLHVYHEYIAAFRRGEVR